MGNQHAIKPQQVLMSRSIFHLAYVQQWETKRRTTFHKSDFHVNVEKLAHFVILFREKSSNFQQGISPPSERINKETTAKPK
jgi:hypothetical protein